MAAKFDLRVGSRGVLVVREIKPRASHELTAGPHPPDESLRERRWPIVGEKHGGIEFLVSVAADLVIDDVADPHHLEEVCRLGGVETARDGEGPDVG